MRSSLVDSALRPCALASESGVMLLLTCSHVHFMRRAIMLAASSSCCHTCCKLFLLSADSSAHSSSAACGEYAFAVAAAAAAASTSAAPETYLYPRAIQRNSSITANMSAAKKNNCARVCEAYYIMLLKSSPASQQLSPPLPARRTSSQPQA
jgi:hypothetical protein